MVCFQERIILKLVLELLN